jgi:hypothetical protein
MGARRHRSTVRASRSRPRSICAGAIRASATRRYGSRPWPACPTRIPPAIRLPESDVRQIVGAAHTVTPQLDSDRGCRCDRRAPVPDRSPRVADLQDKRGDPRLMMPSSKKRRGTKRVERRPVPIPPRLAAKLRAAARARPSGDPPLLQPDGHAGSTPARPAVCRSGDTGRARATHALRHPRSSASS